MKRVLLIITLFCLLMIMGCKQNCSNENVDTDTISVYSNLTTTPDITTPVETTTAVEVPEHKKGQAQARYIYGSRDMERLNVSKKLVWIVNDNVRMFFDYPDEVVSKFNELLVNKYGCDFVVEFQIYPMFEEKFEDEQGNEYWGSRTYLYGEVVKDMIKLGQQTDIIYSGNAYEYANMVETGMYEPLNKYFETSEGKIFYDSYSESIWQRVKKDGQIYGFTGRVEAMSRFACVANKEMADKLGIKLEEEFSFCDLEDMLSEVAIPESKNPADMILPIYIKNYNALLMNEGYYDVVVGTNLQNGIYYKKDEISNKWKVVNVATEENIINLWKKIKEYKEKGWIYFGKSSLNSIMEAGNYVFVIQDVSEAKLVDDKLVCGDTIFDVTVGDMWYNASSELDNCINGISSSSAYKEEAFKLMALINTEEELSNLLQYGIEGTHYIYEDKNIRYLPVPVVAEDGTTYYESRTGYGGSTKGDICNPNLFYSVDIEPDNKLAFYKEIGKGAFVSPEITYDIDISVYSEQISKIKQIYDGYYKKLCMGQYDDVEATVAELNAKLKEAGIDEVVKAINRQLEEAQR